MNHVAKQKGFTIIELMLAMTFVSVLLLAIALTIVQIGTIYNKGITLKEVNQSGRALGDDLRRTIGASSTFSLNRSVVETTAGGRICTGQFSFIWNYADAIETNDLNLVRFNNPNTTEIRFLKVPDASGRYCTLRDDGSPALTRIRTVDAPNSLELLKSGDRELNIHQLSVIQRPNGQSAAGQQLISMTFTLGTGDTEALTDDRTSCKPPGVEGSDFAYCAAQQFSLVIRAGDGVN